MTNTNDLIGLEYGWGNKPGDGSNRTDCFQLVCEVQRRLGLRDYSSDYEWVYQQYTNETFNRRSILRWLFQRGLREPYGRTGSIVVVPNVGTTALGTFLEDGTVIFIGAARNVIRTALPNLTGRFFWVN